MFPFKALLSLTFISLTFVDANPHSRGMDEATLTFATRINENSTLKLVERDQSRAKFLQSGGQHSNDSPSLSTSDTNSVVAYTIQVGFGNPAHKYTLLIDTGSSNTWVGASQRYIPTSTSKDTGDSISVSYDGGAYFVGDEWTDTVTISPGLVVEKQSIGVASDSGGISPFDGILGFGPVDLTYQTVEHESKVPTVLNNLLSQGKISQEVVSFYFVPISEPISNGTITFGGYDSSVTTDSVKYVPITKTSPASESWGIDLSVSYGGTVLQSTTAGIVDTGTTLILLDTDAYQKYQSMTGSTYDPATTLLTITKSKFSALKTLSFHIGDSSYDFTPNAQIWPRSLNTVIGGHSNAIYLVVNTIGSPPGAGLDFILGFVFLERYYSVLDATNKRIGFASTAYTNSEIN